MNIQAKISKNFYHKRNQHLSEISQISSGQMVKPQSLAKRDYEHTFSNKSRRSQFKDPIFRNLDPQLQPLGSPLVPKRISTTSNCFSAQKKDEYMKNIFELKGNPDRMSTQFVSRPMMQSRRRKGNLIEKNWTQQIRGGTTRFSPIFDESFSKSQGLHWRLDMGQKFPLQRKDIPRTRNDVYTRSYPYDEQSCLFKKTLDLSKIYADCPQMYSKRKNYILWVIKSVKSFEFSNEDQVLSRTIQILDFLFCKCEMNTNDTKDLTKIGVTCLWLAAKYEGVHLTLQSLISKLHPNLRKGFGSMKQEMLECENMILKGIDFRISSPVHFDFVENYIFRIFYTKSEKYKNFAKKEGRRRGTRKSIEDGENKNLNTQESNSTNKKLPMSFEKFSKIMEKHRSKMKSLKNKTARQQWRKESKGVLVYPKLEQMLRKMVMYYLKILYHTISSTSKETHIGALACVSLAFESLERLPAREFEDIQATENDKILFYVENSHFSKTQVSNEINSTDMNLITKTFSGPNFQENLKSLDSSKNKSTGVKNTVEDQSIRSSVERNSSSHFGSPHQFFNLNSKGHKSRNSMNVDYTSSQKLWKEPVLDFEKRFERESKVSFKLSQAKEFWEQQSDDVRGKFLKRQCLNFLYFRIYRIISKYFWSEIKQVRMDIHKIEEVFAQLQNFQDFFRMENPFSHVL